MGPLIINLKKLQEQPQAIKGIIEPELLDLDSLDVVIRILGPVSYDIEVSWAGKGIMIQGDLEMPIECTCVKCLTEFKETIRLISWSTYAEVGGEDGLPTDSESVDITPIVREELLFALPAHPVCSSNCQGYCQPEENKVFFPTSIWSTLDQLRL